MTDAPSIQRYFDNFNIIKYIGIEVPWPYPPTGAEEYLRLTLADDGTERYSFAITEAHCPAALIGVIEYRFLDDNDDNRGFWLAEPYWGRGLMSEAVVESERFVFETLGKKRIRMMNATSNIASRRIKQKSGARLVGTKRGTYYSGDLEQQVWEINRDAWRRAGNTPSEDVSTVRV